MHPGAIRVSALGKSRVRFADEHLFVEWRADEKFTTPRRDRGARRYFRAIVCIDLSDARVGPAIRGSADSRIEAQNLRGREFARIAQMSRETEQLRIRGDPDHTIIIDTEISRRRAEIDGLLEPERAALCIAPIDAELMRQSLSDIQPRAIRTQSQPRGNVEVGGFDARLVTIEIDQRRAAGIQQGLLRERPLALIKRVIGEIELPGTRGGDG